MATENEIKPLLDNIKGIREIDQVKLLRPSLGEESLEKSLAPILARLNGALQFIERYASHVHSSYLDPVNNALVQIRNQLQTQAGRAGAAEYISQKPNLLAGLEAQLTQIDQYFPFYVTAAIIKDGLLRDTETRAKETEKYFKNLEQETNSQIREFETYVQTNKLSTIEETKKVSQQVADDVKKAVDEKIEAAMKRAEEIVQSARRTAREVSVKAAQEQFKNVQTRLKHQIWMWAGLSTLSFIAFILLARSFLSDSFSDQGILQAVYHTALRITLLSAAGGLTVYFMRILRAHLHMYQHNQHRQAVTNSIEAFVAAAETSDQRDLILASLVNAVVSFGQSGLIGNESDSIHPSQTIIDAAPRILSSVMHKPQG